MKKTRFSILAILMALFVSSCGTTSRFGLTQNPGATPAQTTTASSGNGGGLSGLLGGLTGGNGNSSTSGLIGNIISTFASGIMTNQASIVGTWTYTKPCVQFESENLFVQAGGAVAATTAENKLAEYYSKIGITEGAFVVNFNQDGTCQMQVANFPLSARYTFDAEKRIINIQTPFGISVPAYVSVGIGQMGLTFDATKVLSLIQTAMSASSSTSAAVSSMVNSVNGMKIGFTFRK